MEGFTQLNPLTLMDVDLSDEVRTACIESILNLLKKAKKRGGRPASGDVYVEESETGVLEMNMRVRLPEVGSVRVPLMSVGPMYWRWSDEGDEN